MSGLLKLSTKPASSRYLPQPVCNGQRVSRSSIAAKVIAASMSGKENT